METDRQLSQAAAAVHAGRLNQAYSILKRLRRSNPGRLDIAAMLGETLTAMHRWDEALPNLLAGTASTTAAASTLRMLAITLNALARHREALEYTTRYLAAEPADVEIAHMRCALLSALGEHEQLLREAPEFSRQHPHQRAFRQAWADTLFVLGKPEAATEVLTRALFDFPSSREISEQTCFSLNTHPAIEPVRVLEIHRNYGRLISQLLPREPMRRRPEGSPDKRLRVGMISPDFVRHSVSCFVRPIAEHRPRERMELWLYHTGGKSDEVTSLLRSGCDHWRDRMPSTVSEAADIIAADQLDVLIDLTGLTRNNALLVMGLKPAPVQITYCGYPNTTGVPQMDFRIVDGITDPQGEPYESQQFSTERLVRIDPCFLCYTPYPDARPPDPAKRRPLDGRGVVFGSFSSTLKYNDRQLGLWRSVLEAVPGSSLLLKNVNLLGEPARRSLAGRLEELGFDMKRVEIAAPLRGTAEHQDLYHQVDICLDTFPYTGTTTTCEALYMGVPVVSRWGLSHASRVGLSLLTAVGHPEWVAADEAEFVSIARSLATDPLRLSSLHRELHQEALASPLMAAQRFGAAFEVAVRHCWRLALGAEVPPKY